MIENNFGTNSPILSLFPFSKKIEVSFTGDRISSDGGLFLLREMECQLGLSNRISNCIQDERDQRYIDHIIEDMLTQPVFQIAAGYEYCKDCNDLRSVPIL